MTVTIAVVPEREVKGGYKVLRNYIQRGIIFHSRDLANSKAVQLSENEPCDHLILCKDEI